MVKDEFKEVLEERMLEFSCICGSIFLPEYKNRELDEGIVNLVKHSDMLDPHLGKDRRFKRVFKCSQCNRFFGVEFKQYPDMLTRHEDSHETQKAKIRSEKG